LTHLHGGPQVLLCQVIGSRQRPQLQEAQQFIDVPVDSALQAGDVGVTAQRLVTDQPAKLPPHRVSVLEELRFPLLSKTVRPVPTQRGSLGATTSLPCASCMSSPLASRCGARPGSTWTFCITSWPAPSM
jgi:hypothetical protein